MTLIIKKFLFRFFGFSSENILQENFSNPYQEEREEDDTRKTFKGRREARGKLAGVNTV